MFSYPNFVRVITVLYPIVFKKRLLNKDCTFLTKSNFSSLLIQNILHLEIKSNYSRLPDILDCQISQLVIEGYALDLNQNLFEESYAGRITFKNLAKTHV